jgi:hypothetical protein
VARTCDAGQSKPSEGIGAGSELKVDDEYGGFCDGQSGGIHNYATAQDLSLRCSSVRGQYTYEPKRGDDYW